MPLILGADRCGKSLVAAMLNCSKHIQFENLLTDLLSYESFKKQQLKLLDELHDQDTNQKYIWLIRHPLESSCSMSENLGVSTQKAMSYWVDINTIIWYFLQSIPQERKIQCRFEQILLTTSSIEKIFKFSNLEFNKQYLYYGDFVQGKCDDRYFNKGHREGEKVNFYTHAHKDILQWNSFKNQEIVIQFGYTRRK